MYYYIFQHGPNRAHQEIHQKIKQQLETSQIQGEQIEADNTAEIRQAAAKALEAKAKTIVAIGDDECLNAVISAVVAGQEGAVAIGFVPTYETNSATTHLLGIRGWKEALSILSARKLHDFSLLTSDNGQAYILADLILRPTPSDQAQLLKCTLDNQLTIEAEGSELKITNLLNQNLPQHKNIVVELLNHQDYHTGGKELLLRLPYAGKKQAAHQTVFRLLANKITLAWNEKTSKNPPNKETTTNNITIGDKVTKIRLIVKKHRTA